MDNLIAVFAILVILGFFASIGTGICFLIMRSRAPGMLKKGFYSSVGIFLCSLVLMIVSLNFQDDTDKENIAAEAQDNYEAVENTATEDEALPVFSYEESAAVTDENGDFSLAITVRKGLPVEFFEPRSDEGASLRKIDESHYVLEGNLPEDRQWGDYYILYGTPNNLEEERISVNNDLAYKPTEDAADIEDEPINNDTYVLDIKMDVEEVMGEYIEVKNEEVAVIDKVQVNDNVGKNDGSKLILIHLNSPIGLTNNKTQQKIDMQTLEITEAIYQNPDINFTIDSITYFWSIPIERKDGTIENIFASKISLERKTLETIKNSRVKISELEKIADQYRSNIQ
ncbi:hypothetical protein NCCP2716_27280 [Sporosarcina sp. NCCP-2716]|uniref:hypothetical protein n=1 Tax=Sporosarcina sp. NCCP-2716 TaxID=2943679 RepID=UPI00203BED01|nr:hypothetical protein [Sporosarcina sp. NCCP-2716]GKV70230.1 hypothetical protein NCCP2716_27280 [Sporosarcina sp. NCCP-2716]